MRWSSTLSIYHVIRLSFISWSSLASLNHTMVFSNVVLSKNYILSPLGFTFISYSFKLPCTSTPIWLSHHENGSQSQPVQWVLLQVSLPSTLNILNMGLDIDYIISLRQLQHSLSQIPSCTNTNSLSSIITLLISSLTYTYHSSPWLTPNII